MYYLTIGGQRYGPADVEKLTQWANEGRLLPTSILEDAATGVGVAASSVPGLAFPMGLTPQPVMAPTYPASQMTTWNQPGFSPYSSAPSALVENTSGMGGPVPPEVARMHWNWGAFSLSFLWMLNHGMVGLGIGFFVIQFIPYLNIVTLPICIVLGIKGHEFAWQKRRYDGFDQFMAVERTWSTWGIVFFILGIIGGIAIGICIVFAAAIGLSSGLHPGSGAPFLNAPPDFRFLNGMHQ